MSDIKSDTNNLNNLLNNPPKLHCMCCNQELKVKYICFFYYGTMISLCGNPCGVKTYLDTQ